MEEDSEYRKKFGEEVYKAAGSPMFTKLWTRDELLTVERLPGLGRKVSGKTGAGFKRPDNWPTDTDVAPGGWVFWLPDGWGQGIRTQIQSGKSLRCYMNPDGRRFWHKPDIEKFLGIELPKMEKAPEDDEEEKVPRVRYVTDPDAMPLWPGDNPEWLPRDFKLAYRQLPSGLHRIYVPPGKEDDGFLYHREDVLKYLAAGFNLSPFGTSKPQVEKTGTKRRAEALTLADFETSASLQVIKLGGSADTYAAMCEALRGAAGDPDHAGLAAEAERILAVLPLRGFVDAELIYVFCTVDGEEPPPHAAVLSGFYIRRPHLWEDKPFYQSIFLHAGTSSGVACGPLHLLWSASCADGGRWKLGQLITSNFAGCLAVSADSGMSGKWLLPPMK